MDTTPGSNKTNDTSGEVDIYDDLPDLQISDTLQKLEEENKCLRIKLAELTAEIESEKSRNQELQSLNKTLNCNISVLYKTAAAEIERKDSQIRDLRREKNDLIFRRAARGKNLAVTSASHNHTAGGQESKVPAGGSKNFKKNARSKTKKLQASAQEDILISAPNKIVELKSELSSDNQSTKSQKDLVERCRREQTGAPCGTPSSVHDSGMSSLSTNQRDERKNSVNEKSRNGEEVDDTTVVDVGSKLTRYKDRTWHDKKTGIKRKALVDESAEEPEKLLESTNSNVETNRRTIWSRLGPRNDASVNNCTERNVTQSSPDSNKENSDHSMNSASSRAKAVGEPPQQVKMVPTVRGDVKGSVLQNQSDASACNLLGKILDKPSKSRIDIKVEVCNTSMKDGESKSENKRSILSGKDSYESLSKQRSPQVAVEVEHAHLSELKSLPVVQERISEEMKEMLKLRSQFKQESPRVESENVTHQPESRSKPPLPAAVLLSNSLSTPHRDQERQPGLLQGETAASLVEQDTLNEHCLSLPPRREGKCQTALPKVKREAQPEKVPVQSVPPLREGQPTPPPPLPERQPTPPPPLPEEKSAPLLPLPEGESAPLPSLPQEKSAYLPGKVKSPSKSHDELVPQPPLPEEKSSLYLLLSQAQGETPPQTCSPQQQSTLSITTVEQSAVPQGNLPPPKPIPQDKSGMQPHSPHEKNTPQPSVPLWEAATRPPLPRKELLPLPPLPQGEPAPPPPLPLTTPPPTPDKAQGNESFGSVSLAADQRQEKATPALKEKNFLVCSTSLSTSVPSHSTEEERRDSKSSCNSNLLLEEDIQIQCPFVSRRRRRFVKLIIEPEIIVPVKDTVEPVAVQSKISSQPDLKKANRGDDSKTSGFHYSSDGNSKKCTADSPLPKHLADHRLNKSQRFASSNRHLSLSKSSVHLHERRSPSELLSGRSGRVGRISHQDEMRIRDRRSQSHSPPKRRGSPCRERKEDSGRDQKRSNKKSVSRRGTRENEGTNRRKSLRLRSVPVKPTTAKEDSRKKLCTDLFGDSSSESECTRAKGSISKSNHTPSPAASHGSNKDNTLNCSDSNKKNLSVGESVEAALKQGCKSIVPTANTSQKLECSSSASNNTTDTAENCVKIIRRRSRSAKLEDSDAFIPTISLPIKCAEAGKVPSLETKDLEPFKNQASKLVSTPLDFRERYAEVFNNSRIESSEEGEFSESDSTTSGADSDVSYTPKQSLKRPRVKDSKGNCKKKAR